jgi:hypothetical protein
MAMRSYANVRLQCIAVVVLSRKAIFVAPIVALAIGVWAEFAHLTPPVLFVVSVPAIVMSTVSAAYLTRRVPWPIALVVAGALVGMITFGLAEGTHVAIHLARGDTLDFNAYHSEAAKAFALIGIHLAAGAMVGAGVGAGLAVLWFASGLLGPFDRLRVIARTVRPRS